MDASLGPTPGPVPVLDELEHQALDLLDALPGGAAWQSFAWAKRGAAEGDAEALLEEVESVEEVEAAVARVEPAFERVLAQVAANLIDAAAWLAGTDARGALDLDVLLAARTKLTEQPELAAVIEPASELTRQLLGLSPGSVAAAVLDDLGSRVDANERALLAACTAAIRERLQAAGSTAGLPEPLARPLRVFRSAAIAQAGPSARAQTLAAEQPELLELAMRLVAVHRDPLTLVEAYDAARSAIDGPPPEPHEVIDGPKRKFTIVHVVLAAIVLGLTLWHYIVR